MIQNFRTYELARGFYRHAKTLRAPAHLKDQLMRASSSIALNLAEGWGKPTKKDQIRFYAIAFGSVREVQAIIDLLDSSVETMKRADHLAACVYKLVYKNGGR